MSLEKLASEIRAMAEAEAKSVTDRAGVEAMSIAKSADDEVSGRGRVKVIDQIGREKSSSMVYGNCYALLKDIRRRQENLDHPGSALRRTEGRGIENPFPTRVKGS